MKNLKQDVLDRLDDNIERLYDKIMESDDLHHIEQLESSLEYLKDVRDNVEFVEDDKLEEFLETVNL